MTPPTPALRRRGAAFRAAVLDAAVQELAEHGVAEARVARIAARAGVHETSIYRGWATREELLVEALLQRSETEIPTPDTGSARDDLLAVAEAIRAWLSTSLGRATLRAATLEAGGAAEEARRRFWRGRVAALAPVVERGIARGELRADTDARLLLQAIVSPMHIHALAEGAAIPRDLPVSLVDLVLRGAAH